MKFVALLVLIIVLFLIFGCVEQPVPFTEEEMLFCEQDSDCAVTAVNYMQPNYCEICCGSNPIRKDVESKLWDWYNSSCPDGSQIMCNCAFDKWPTPVCIENKCSVRMDERVVVYGEVKRSKGLFVIDDYGVNDLNSDYLGKIVEIKGAVTDYPCDDDLALQCYGGEIFSKVFDFRVIDFNEVGWWYDNFNDLSETATKYLNGKIDITNSDFICSKYIFQFGDMNYHNVDINSIYLLNVPNGIIVHFSYVPSACECGDVYWGNKDVFIDVGGKTAELRTKITKQDYSESCIN